MIDQNKLKGRKVASLLIVLVLFVGAVALATQDQEGPVLVARDKIFDVKFVSDREAWAIGYPGLILHTTDAGGSWQRVNSHTKDALFALDFAGEQGGWIVGRDGLLLITKDSGSDWQVKESLCNDPLFDVDFIDEKNGVIIGYFGQIHTTEDGGQTWQAHELEVMMNASINAVHVMSKEVIWLAGEAPLFELDYNEELSEDAISNVYKSVDGGETWLPVKTGTYYTLYDIYFTDDLNGWAVGAKGTMVATQDGGESWRKIETNTKSQLLKLYANKDAVWTVGTEGVVYKVAGDAVKRVDVKAYTWLSSIAFSGIRGLIVGGRGTILSTRDNGKTWEFYPIKR